MRGRLAAVAARGAGLAAVALLAAVPPAGAQVPADTAVADTAAADTVDQTARFLEAQAQVAVRTPVLPRIGTTAPLPPGGRIVFTRDSLDWLDGITLGDLLRQVPGVYLWRGGWYGRTESVAYRARGATSAEYLLDGVPYLPVGIDSVGVDPAFIALSFLERVEVERLPGQLRVHLFTRRHDRLAPRSRIGITTGDADIARYEGALERRFASGVGFAAAADYLSSPTIAVRNSSYSNNHLWLQGSYLPSEQIGLQYQLVRSAPKRRPFVVAAAGTGVENTLSLGYEATRTDAQLRLSYRSRADGLGPSLNLLYGRTSWDGGGVDQQIHQLGGTFALRHPVLALTGAAFYRSRWTPLDSRASLAWTPVGGVSAGAEAAYQIHDGDRTSQWTVLRAGLQPFGPLALTGAARIGEEVPGPAVDTAAAQRIRDYEVAVRWESQGLGLHLAFTRTAAFAPAAPAEFLRIAALAPVPATEWVTAAVRLTPMRWLTLDGWYSDPRQPAGVEGLPPSHSAARFTVRSKFWRTFPSGAFDLKLQLTLESWGTGTIGRDEGGAPITLKGATFLGSLIQFEIGSFAFFWERGNLTASSLGYVPGFRMPPYATAFGVRWGFLN